jgi:hypothetical protein
MGNLLIHSMETAWQSSDQNLLAVAPDALVFVEGSGSNRLEAKQGAQGAAASFTPGAPLNLEDYEELRFWVRSDTPATGEPPDTFYLEFTYTDANDAQGEEHRWFVPVNQAGVWEQRRIGIGNDRRGAVNSLRFVCLNDLPFVCHVDELLAVREEMLADVERALGDLLGGRLKLPGLADRPLKETAKPGDTSLILEHTPAFEAGCLVVVRGGSEGDEEYLVKTVTHNEMAKTTTLEFADDDKVAGTLNAGNAFASMTVPLIFETPPEPTTAPNPAIIATLLDMREDPERTSYVTQRDSFRPRGDLLTYATRAAARAYQLEYQFTAVAVRREHQLLAYTHLLRSLGSGGSLRVNGSHAPVRLTPPPPLEGRGLGAPSPVYARVGTRMETAERTEVPAVRRVALEAAHSDSPLEHEEIVL